MVVALIAVLDLVITLYKSGANCLFPSAHVVQVVVRTHDTKLLAHNGARLRVIVVPGE